jgi:hypothetical protein
MDLHGSVRPFLLPAPSGPTKELTVGWNPENLNDMARLRNGIRDCREKLEPFREERADAVKQYLGGHYGHNRNTVETPTPFLRLAVNIYTRHLVAQNPKALITTMSKQLKPMAKIFELDLEDRMRLLKLDKMLQRWVMHAIFCVGIIEVSRDYQTATELEGEEYIITDLKTEDVSVADWVVDINASRYDKAEFAGYRARINYDDFLASPLFDADTKKRVKPNAYLWGEERDDDPVRSLQTGDAYDPNEYDKFLDVWRIWVRREGVILTLPMDGPVWAMSTEPWTGPDDGPFQFLGFGDAPDMLMPTAPVDLLRDLDDFGNNLWTKMRDQAKGQKTVFGYQGDAADDAERVMKADDLEGIAMDKPDGLKEYQFGGIDARTMAMFIQNKQLISYFGGNLDAVGGLSTQADTLGQERMLVGSASKMMDDLQAKTITAVRKLLETIAYFEWNDAMRDPELEMTMPGTQQGIPVSFAQENRQGNFSDYRFDIQPYSMRDEGPGAKLQNIMQFLQWLGQGNHLERMAQQGIMLDYQELLDIVAQYQNMTEMNQLFTSASEPMGVANAGPDSGGRSDVSERITTRVNKPGATGPGQDEIMSKVLMGAGPQGSEVDSLTRSAV